MSLLPDACLVRFLSLANAILVRSALCLARAASSSETWWKSIGSVTHGDPWQNMSRTPSSTIMVSVFIYRNKWNNIKIQYHLDRPIINIIQEANNTQQKTFVLNKMQLVLDKSSEVFHRLKKRETDSSKIITYNTKNSKPPLTPIHPYSPYTNLQNPDLRG